jgi:cytochrome c-type biogenesis protein CcmH/NrfG
LLVVGVGAVAAGGVHGRTVVVAAVVVVVIVAISAAVGCCSWQKVAMLE